MALLLAATMASGLLVGAPGQLVHSSGRASALSMSLHALTATAMDGAEIKLDSLAGKRVIALNVACVPLPALKRTRIDCARARACHYRRFPRALASRRAAPNEAARAECTRRSPISTKR